MNYCRQRRYCLNPQWNLRQRDRVNTVGTAITTKRKTLIPVALLAVPKAMVFKPLDWLPYPERWHPRHQLCCLGLWRLLICQSLAAIS